MARQSKKAKQAAATVAVMEAPESNEAIAPEEVIEAIAPDTFSIGIYTFEYTNYADGTCYPVFKVKGELFFSGWVCKSRKAAKSLLISIYYQVSGVLKGSTAVISADLLATHPLSDLIYPDDNTGTIEESFDENGNRTDVFRVVVNPSGLALSGNTRLSVLEARAARTGVAEMVHISIASGTDDVALILGGNQQREKTPQDKVNEAMVKASAMGGRRFWTNVRNIYIADFGLSGGYFDATVAVMKYVKSAPETDFSRNVKSIAEQNPTIAHELIKLQQSAANKDGSALPPEEGQKKMGAELSKMARAKNAAPIDRDLVYDGIAIDAAEIRKYYTGESVVEIIRVLTESSPETRLELIRQKAAGDRQKMSILKEQIENPEPENTGTPDWNAVNDEEEALADAAPAVDPNADYYKKMRKEGIFEEGCWLLNASVSEALNEAIGGIADVDPFAEPTGNIKCDRRITALENPLEIEHWGGGVHDSGRGLKVATALPPKEGLIPTATELFKRIENGQIGEAAFVVEASILFLPRFTAYLRSLPLAWVLVARENAREATEGFGFEPSPFLLDNPRFRQVKESAWNERCCSYAIIYYGSNYDRFEKACGKYGALSYNAKAAKARSLQFDWTEADGTLTALNDGNQYAIDVIGDTYFLLVDGVRKPDKYKTADHAKRAAIIESLGM